MAAQGNLVIPDHDYLISVRNDYNLCKAQALRDYHPLSSISSHPSLSVLDRTRRRRYALQACDSTAKAQGRAAMNLKLAQGKAAGTMPRPLRLRGYQGHVAAAEVIRQAAQGGKRKRRKTRKHKKKHRRKTRKSRKRKKRKRRKSKRR